MFVDFDNIFGGLHDADRTTAFAFGERPGEWLDELVEWGLLEDERREFLVCRAYLNPAGWVADEEFGNDQGRVYLQRFRPALTRAGFEVVDCPNLTAAHKNAADIRMVIDVMTALTAPVRYDEFVIASSDADFTPLLHRLRADDRRTVVFAAVNPASAYQNVATAVLDAATVLAPVTRAVRAAAKAGDGPQRTGDDTGGLAARAAAAAARPVGSSPDSELRARAAALVNQTVAGSAGAVHLSNLGTMLRTACGNAVDESNWFGRGSLGAFVKSIAKPLGLQVHGYYVWDPARHDGPDQTTPTGIPRPTVPASVEKFCGAAGLPALDTDGWRVLFDLLAEYSSSHELVVNECAVWTRDRLALAGMLVGRREIVAVVIAALQADDGSANRLPTHAADVREQVLITGATRLRSAGTRLSEEQLGEVRAWLSGGGVGGVGWSASLPAPQASAQ